MESDNDRLKGEVLPKREELLETERRLSEKTNALREVKTNILFISNGSGRRCTVSLLIYCFM